MLEMLMDPLGALVITFFVMSIISIVAIALLYFSKNDKVKKGLLYFLAVWGVVIAYCGMLATGSYLSVVFGALGIAGILIQLISKKENKFQIARILAAVSVVAGMVNCFLI